ncbi:MAG: metalloregulator ArsR/SmtB family transcription factor [Candidatus Margulisiibacteriota bacterium]
MKTLEKTLKALADKNRLRILKLLEQKPMCVCELVYTIKISQSTVSKHLKKLVDTELVIAKQDGLWTNYQLNINNIYSQILLSHLNDWLNDDKVIISDIKKARQANRVILCK